MFEPVLAPGTHIGVRENGDVKKPSHTGTRKHARFTPIMKVRTTHNTHTCILYTLHTLVLYLCVHITCIYTHAVKNIICVTIELWLGRKLFTSSVSLYTGYQFGWREPSIGMHSIVYFVDLLP